MEDGVQKLGRSREIARSTYIRVFDEHVLVFTVSAPTAFSIQSRLEQATLRRGAFALGSVDGAYSLSRVETRDVRMPSHTLTVMSVVG